MKSSNVLSNLSSAALLDLLGLQSKPSTSSRVLTYAGFAAAGLVVGAAAALLLTPKNGRELRSDLRLGARDLTNQVSATAASAIDVAKRKGAELKNHASAAAADITNNA
jgi:hypothetical protein